MQAVCHSLDPDSMSAGHGSGMPVARAAILRPPAGLFSRQLATDEASPRPLL